MNSKIKRFEVAKQMAFALLFMLATGFVSRAQLLFTQDASGNAFCDGAAYLDSMNVFPPIVWTNLSTNQNMPAQGDFSIWMLCPGDYAVSFNDANGNNITVVFNIGGQGNNNPCAGFNASMSTTNTDLNTCNGSASITVNGGTAPYTYSWANQGPANQNISMLNNLCAGNYTATITDANGCIFNVSGIVYEGNSGGGTTPTDTIIVIMNNTFPPNSVTDTLPTVSILDCNIDFDSIASAAITNVLQTNMGVMVTWTVYDINGNIMATYDVQYDNVNPNGAIYEATLILMCGRSIQVVLITDQFEYVPGSAGNIGNAVFEFSIVNPMHNNLRVQFNENFEGKLTLMDMKGALIFSQDVNAISFDYNVSPMSPGMYVLQIESKKGVSAVKLMK